MEVALIERAQDGPRLGLRCKGWRQEAILRLLDNVLEIGERPEDLVVYAACGKAARDERSYQAIRAALMELEEDETLVLQSGRPVAVLRTGMSSPLVVSAVNNVVGRYSSEAEFHRRVEEGATMWGGLTAGAWQYIGAQGVLQGVHEVLAAVAREHFGGSIAGRLVVTSGLGGMGSAQPTAIRMHGARGIVVEVDELRVQQRRRTGVLDVVAASLDEALAAVRGAPDGTVVGLVGNAADVVPELVQRSVVPDIVTDMTAAHDLRRGYLPAGVPLARWQIERDLDPDGLARRAQRSIAAQVRAMRALSRRGAVVFENGNQLRLQALEGGEADAFDVPGFAERYVRPLFCDGIGPFRWIAVSGQDADLDVIDDVVASLVPERPDVARWIDLARRHVARQGLPARSCWLGHGERSRVALAVNALVASGELAGPVVFTRDHFDAAGMTHPYIGTEGMADGSDAVADWPLLDAMLLAASGADLVAIHAGGASYSGLMQSAGTSIVADGSPRAAARLQQGLDADTALGVVRYAEAGYEAARDRARRDEIGWVAVGAAPDERSRDAQVVGEG